MVLKKIFYGALSSILFLFGILIFNWYDIKQDKTEVASVNSLYQDDSSVSETLSQLIRFKTVSIAEHNKVDLSQFQQLITYLHSRFPDVFKVLKIQPFNEQAILLEWPGSDSQLSPVMFTAHYDVVRAENENWKHAPFSGHIDDQYIWGRGALDDKSAIVAIFHSLKTLINADYQPKRTMYFAFGGDEEVGGQLGAKKISDFLSSNKIKLKFLLDEGMPIADGIMKGLEKPVAMIGIAEKGYVNLKLTATTSGGHSSSPPKQTAIGVLATAIQKLEQQPMQATISKPIGLLFDTLAQDMQGVQGIAVSNRWLTESILTGQLAKQNSTNALIRTTFATTMIEGSKQVNVLPKNATANINVRILPGDSTQSVVSHVENVIDDERIKIMTIGNKIEPSSVSDINNLAYQLIETAIKETFPDILVAPSLLIASTDAKHYQPIVENIYRFRPFWIRSEDIARLHGKNERISIENLKQMTMFYHQLIKKTGKSSD